MSDDVLNQVFATFKVTANVFHNGQYCGNWSIDTSGSHYLSFHLVTHGKCFLMVNQKRDEIITLNQGDFVMFPRDSQHCISNEPTFESETNTSQSSSFQQGIEADGTGLVCGYFVHQHPLVKQMTDHLPEQIIISPSEAGLSPTSKVVKLLVDESLASDRGSGFILEKLSECLLALILREHLTLDKGLFAALANNKLNPAISAIIRQPSHKWKLENLASLSHMSRTSFSELFREIVGQSVMEYLTYWRISVAYRLLADQGISTLAAATEVGYDNESSFSKAFKRVLGVNPGAVRAKRDIHG